MRFLTQEKNKTGRKKTIKKSREKRKTFETRYFHYEHM